MAKNESFDALHSVVGPAPGKRGMYNVLKLTNTAERGNDFALKVMGEDEIARLEGVTRTGMTLLGRIGQFVTRNLPLEARVRKGRDWGFNRAPRLDAFRRFLGTTAVTGLTHVRDGFYQGPDQTNVRVDVDPRWVVASGDGTIAGIPAYDLLVAGMQLIQNPARLEQQAVVPKGAASLASVAG